MSELAAPPPPRPEPDYEATLALDLFTGAVVVRVVYRDGGRRTRRSFVLVPDAGESLESVQAKIAPAIAAHAQLRG